jgi:threonine dehydrogenase-like Zn-dependent dehydrogenase
MQALHLDRDGTLSVADVPEPALADASSVRIAVAVAGVCGSDWQSFRQPRPAANDGILGHEITGTVVEAGAGASAWLGRRVCVDPMISCGVCVACLSGRKHFCVHGNRDIGRDYPGGFAEFVCVPQSQLLELPAALPFRSATFVEPLAVIVRAFRAAALDASTRLAVVGDGTLAFLALSLARARGCAGITLIYKHAARAALAEELGICDVAIHAEALTAAEHQRYDAVIEAVGGHQSASIRDAVDLVRQTGTIVALGAFGADYRDGFPYRKAFRKEVRLQGVNAYGVLLSDPNAEFRESLGLLADGSLLVEAIVERYVPLADAAPFLANIVGGARTVRPKAAIEVLA